MNTFQNFTQYNKTTLGIDLIKLKKNLVNICICLHVFYFFAVNFIHIFAKNVEHIYAFLLQRTKNTTTELYQQEIPSNLIEANFL